MTDSKRVAGLLGPSLIALTLSEMMNAHIWAAIIAPVTYLAGALWFVPALPSSVLTISGDVAGL